MKPIFIHLKACNLSDRQLKKITDAGYVTLAVDSFESVRVGLELSPLVGGDPISIAAFQSIARAGYSTQSDFGERVAKALSVLKLQRETVTASVNPKPTPSAATEEEQSGVSDKGSV